MVQAGQGRKFQLSLCRWSGRIATRPHVSPLLFLPLVFLAVWLFGYPSLPSLLLSSLSSLHSSSVHRLFSSLATDRPATPSSDRVEECDRSADPNMNCRYPHLHQYIISLMPTLHSSDGEQQGTCLNTTHSSRVSLSWLSSLQQVESTTIILIDFPKGNNNVPNNKLDHSYLQYISQLSSTWRYSTRTHPLTNILSQQPHSQ